MPTEYSWPRVRALLDEALQSERGISIDLPTWREAENIRFSAYKLRNSLRRESMKLLTPDHPNYGIGVYDGLSMWISSALSGGDLRVTFDNGAQVDGPEFKIGRRGENTDFYSGEIVTVEVTTSQRKVIVQSAPSFREAWAIIRADFPATLIIENGYSLDHLNINVL